MKNVTISMDDADLAWVRAQAGAAGVSVSRWMADKVAERHRRDREIAAASKRIDAIYDDIRKAQEAERVAGVVYPPRTQTYREMIDEGYDERFRRFDHADLSDGHERAGEGGRLRGVAERGETFRGSGSEPAGSQ